MRIAGTRYSSVLRMSLLLVVITLGQAVGCRRSSGRLKRLPVETVISLSMNMAQTACARDSQQMDPDCINTRLRADGNGILEVIPADDDYESAPSGRLIVGEVRRTSDGRYLTEIFGATPFHCKISEILPLHVHDDEMEWYRDQRKNSRRVMVVVYYGQQLRYWREY